MKNSLLKKIGITALSAAMVLSMAACGSSSSTGSSTSSSSSSDSSSSSSSSGSGDTIKIGVSGPTTGDSAESGKNVNTGIQMAIDEFNEAGGITIDGTAKQVEAVYYDSGSDPQTGNANCEKLVTSDKVDFLWCDTFNSAVGISTMELAAKYPDMPMATLEPVSSAITEKIVKDPDTYKNFYKYGWDSSAYGESLANTLLEYVESGSIKMKDKTLAVCADDTDYGRSNMAAIVDVLKENGYTVKSENYWSFGSTDLYSIVNDIKNSGASAILSCSTNTSTGVALIKQLNENGLGELPNLAIYYPMMPEFKSQIGDQADGLIYAPFLLDTENNQVQADFAQKLKDYNGDELTFDHMDGYACMKAVLNAMKNAGTLDPDKLRDALLSQDGIDTPIGKVVLDADTHTLEYGPDTVPVNTAQIQNGKPVVIYPDAVKTGDISPVGVE